MKRCVVCRVKFEPRSNSLQVACSPACALEFARSRPERLARVRKRAGRMERAEVLAMLQSPAKAAQKAQAAFNAWVRARDAGLPCVSCGWPDNGSRQRVAGHYIPRGRSPALRFDERNVHGQCGNCNTHLSGNLTPYRVELIRRLGLSVVEWLEGPHELPHRTIEDFRAIEREYRKRAKVLGSKAA